MAKVDWSIRDSPDAIQIALNRYKRFLEQESRRPSTISSYLFHVERYLRFANADRPAALPRVNAVIEHIKAKGAQPLLIASGSADSYHIHIPIVEAELEASHEFTKAIHNELKQAHKDLDLKHDTETFPKQKTARGKKVGNTLKLPLAINRNSGNRAQILDADTKEPMDVVFITKVAELRAARK